MPSSALTPAIRDEIERLGSADIMVGIPSYRNAATIGHVVRAAQAGLVQYFPDLRPVLVNADAGSPDGTRPGRRGDGAARLRRADPAGPPDATAWPASASPTPTSTASAARAPPCGRCSRWPPRCEVQALVVVDSDLRSIVPEWIELLAGPILKGGYDFVTPLYARHKYDGTITNTVTYPVTRALYGHRIRQPIGGDFGVSGDLIRHYLAQDELDARRVALRHRHLDDDDGPDRRLRGLPDPARRQDPRPQGPGLGPGADVPPGRRHAADHGPPTTPSAGWRSPAATTSRPTASSATSIPRPWRSTRCGCWPSSTRAR